MNQEQFDQLEKDVNYANLEGLAPEGKQYMLFRNSDEAIKALRNNEIPGVKWDEECERKYLEMLSNNNATE